MRFWLLLIALAIAIIFHRKNWIFILRIFLLSSLKIRNLVLTVTIVQIWDAFIITKSDPLTSRTYPWPWTLLFFNIQNIPLPLILKMQIILFPLQTLLQIFYITDIFIFIWDVLLNFITLFLNSEDFLIFPFIIAYLSLQILLFRIERYLLRGGGLLFGINFKLILIITNSEFIFLAIL